MPFRRRSGKTATDLTPAQRDVVARLERGELSAEEAGRLLAESARVEPHPAPALDEPAGPPETPEERAARELVERLAQEAYGDPPG